MEVRLLSGPLLIRKGLTKIERKSFFSFLRLDCENRHQIRVLLLPRFSSAVFDCRGPPGPMRNTRGSVGQHNRAWEDDAARPPAILVVDEATSPFRDKSNREQYNRDSSPRPLRQVTRQCQCPQSLHGTHGNALGRNPARRCRGARVADDAARPPARIPRSGRGDESFPRPIQPGTIQPGLVASSTTPGDPPMSMFPEPPRDSWECVGANPARRCRGARVADDAARPPARIPRSGRGDESFPGTIQPGLVASSTKPGDPPMSIIPEPPRDSWECVGAEPSPTLPGSSGRGRRGKAASQNSS